MNQHTDRLRFFLAMCLTAFSVGMARGALPDNGPMNPNRSASADLHETMGGQLKVRVGD